MIFTGKLKKESQFPHEISILQEVNVTGLCRFQELEDSSRTNFLFNQINIIVKIVTNLACFVPLKVFVEYSLYSFFHNLPNVCQYLGSPFQNQNRLEKACLWVLNLGYFFCMFLFSENTLTKAASLLIPPLIKK